MDKTIKSYEDSPLKVFAIFFYISVLFSGCVKEDIDDYDKSIVGVWNYSHSTGLFGVLTNWNYIFYADGTWQFTDLDPGRLFKLNGKQCQVEIDEAERIKFIDRYGYEPVTKRLPYHLQDNLLILQRHTDLYDTLTPLVNDTLEIVELKKCTLLSGLFYGKGLTFRAYDENTIQRRGSESYTLHLMIYKAPGKECSACGCD